MENLEEKTKKEAPKKQEKSLSIIPILVALVLVGGGLWFVSGNQSQNSAISAEEDAHGKEDEHGHEDEGGHEEGGHNEEGHGGHDEHGEEQAIKLTAAEMAEFGIEIQKADAGTLYRYVDLPGEVRANGDRLAHLVPRVPGVVKKVLKGLGDSVKKGEVMALLESRELSDLKADFLASVERVTLAQTSFDREKSLWEKKISSEQDYLEAKRDLAESKIERRSAEQKLHALGFSTRYLADLPNHPEGSFTQYEIIAPFSGRVIEKHITLGEVLQNDSGAFVIADLSTVWVDLSVYQKDLHQISEGQLVVIKTTQDEMKTEGTLSYLGPILGEETRTALARIVLPNKNGMWRPGLFVNAKVAVGEIESDLIVPKSAVQKIKDEDVLFVMAHGGLEPKAVKLGRSDEMHVEIIEGINWGDAYVSKGGFTLRAQLGVGDLDDGHNH